VGVSWPKSKIEEQRFVEGSWRTDDQKWLDSIEKPKRSTLKFCDRRTDGHKDRVNC